MQSASEIAFTAALDLVELYRSKALSPVEATQVLLARLDALQSALNAFCVIDRDGALAAARASEQRWRAGQPLSPLDGVPATIKDLVLMRGFPTLRGSRLVDPEQDWSEDGPAVARLREAGAVILGKTTTPEFGWKAIGDSPLTGITRNPWNLRAHHRRQQRRRRRRLRRRDRPAQCRQRRRRLDPHPLCLHRHCRAQGEFRPGAGLSVLADGPPIECRADDAHCARRGGDAQCAGAARPPRSLRPPAREPRLPRRDRGGRARLADRLQPRSRLCQGRSRNCRCLRQRGAAIRGFGRHRR